ncbi:translesion error-prone DNA polymerase V autoproteolytic subunit [Desulfolutivibrio sp.]|uniref:translesion error-prone DNA polymerase V autoproteolytic subunit n=1 Tax=Desulfolutivibrio sp. TaxID=2773296 RepID=UPI002F9696E3
MTSTVSGLEILGFEKRSACALPLYLASVPAGFPSPAEDYIDKKLDLNEHLVKHPAATFFVRVHGHSMTDAGISPGDILVVDRAVTAASGNIVIAALDGELTVKRLKTSHGRLLLVPENTDYAPTEVDPEQSFEIWGVVTYIIHKAVSRP